MGTWKLEVLKMSIYMAFPVAMFHYFNQPEYFETWVTKVKREIYPPENKYQREEFLQNIREIRRAQELKALQELQDSATNS